MYCSARGSRAQTKKRERESKRGSYVFIRAEPFARGARPIVYNFTEPTNALPQQQQQLTTFAYLVPSNDWLAINKGRALPGSSSTNFADNGARERRVCDMIIARITRQC